VLFACLSPDLTHRATTHLGGSKPCPPSQHSGSRPGLNRGRRTAPFSPC